MQEIQVTNLKVDGLTKGQFIAVTVKTLPAKMVRQWHGPKWCRRRLLQTSSRLRKHGLVEAPKRSLRAKNLASDGVPDGLNCAGVGTWSGFESQTVMHSGRTSFKGLPSFNLKRSLRANHQRPSLRRSLRPIIIAQRLAERAFPQGPPTVYRSRAANPPRWGRRARQTVPGWSPQRRLGEANVAS